MVSNEQARGLATERDLDLVEVASNARPPVCKLMDYSKFKYEQSIRAREMRRRQSLSALKEMKMRPKIDQHDYETKKSHVVRFIKQGHKVKVTIMFRGREMAHTELAQVDSPARQDGRNMITVFSPRKSALPPGAKPSDNAEPATGVRPSAGAVRASSRPAPAPTSS